jgi:hypothetical protein
MVETRSRISHAPAVSTLQRRRSAWAARQRRPTILLAPVSSVVVCESVGINTRRVHSWLKDIRIRQSGGPPFARKLRRGKQSVRVGCGVRRRGSTALPFCLRQVYLWPSPNLWGKIRVDLRNSRHPSSEIHRRERRERRKIGLFLSVPSVASFSNPSSVFVTFVTFVWKSGPC